MTTITHEKQQKIWEEEHKNPKTLKQMDSNDASSGVIKFWDFINPISQNLHGLEMGCGKGRNVLWLAQKGVEAYGFDFSPFAITEAKKRAQQNKVEASAHFFVQDATLPWNFKSNSFDFCIDCFASTDIESVKGREFAISELFRVLKPGGYMLAYLLSTDDEFHKEMIVQSPAEEKNAFLNPVSGKFEKTFDEKDLSDLYKNFKIIKKERVSKTAEFFGKDYACQHFWVIFQKPE